MISVLLWAKLELLVQFSAYFHMYEWSWKHYFKPNFKVRIMASDKKKQTGPRCFLLHLWMFYYIKQRLKMTDLVEKLKLLYKCIMLRHVIFGVVYKSRDSQTWRQMKSDQLIVFNWLMQLILKLLIESLITADSLMFNSCCMCCSEYVLFIL